MKIFLSRILLVIILPILDYFVFKSLRNLFPKLKNSKVFTYSYWSLTFITVGFLLLYSVVHNVEFRDKYWVVFTTIVAVIVIVFSPKFVAAIIFLQRLLFKIIFKNAKHVLLIDKTSKVLIILFAIILEILIFKGIFYDRFDFQVSEYNLSFNNLPDSFNEYRIVHLSDLHLGSFRNHKSKLKEIVEITNSLNPDLIVFTGDLVNNITAEAWDVFEILNELSAKDGIIAVTGNHDYGTYVSWPCEKDFDENFNQLIVFYDSLGAKLLLNESVKIIRDNEYIFISGIESSGMPPFDELGDIDKAIEGIGKNDFTILLSHDPSFWRSRVLNYPNVDLSLSGHTHSMQVAFDSKLFNFRWSPVQYIYEEWHGLYHSNNQKLVINNGAGYIAMPLRIGAKPEIGLIVLHN